MKEKARESSKALKEPAAKTGSTAEKEEADSSLRQSAIFQYRKRPGPVAEDAPSTPEQDLEDAALMVGLIDLGALRVDSPGGKEAVLARPSLARISAQEDEELAKRVQIWGDMDARNRLVMANMGLVYLMAHQMMRPFLRYEDLVQEGIMGLMRATETFEPGHHVRFSTYGVYWIRSKMQRLIQKLEKDDTPHIVGTNWQTDEGGHKHRPKARKLSLDQSFSNEAEGGHTLEEVLPASADTPEEAVLKLEKETAVHRALDEILTELDDDRLKIVIESRLLAEEPTSLSVLGERLQLSREGVRLLESKMLKMAREKLAAWR